MCVVQNHLSLAPILPWISFKDEEGKVEIERGRRHWRDFVVAVLVLLLERCFDLQS